MKRDKIEKRNVAGLKSFCPHLSLLVQSVSGQRERREGDELKEEKEDKRWMRVGRLVSDRMVRQ